MKHYFGKVVNYSGKKPGSKLSYDFEGFNKKSAFMFELNGFSYFDPETQTCKLCYESVYSVKLDSGKYLMINKLDKKPHRVRMKFCKGFFCKMGKKLETVSE